MVVVLVLMRLTTVPLVSSEPLASVPPVRFFITALLMRMAAMDPFAASVTRHSLALAQQLPRRHPRGADAGGSGSYWRSCRSSYRVCGATRQWRLVTRVQFVVVTVAPDTERFECLRRFVIVVMYWPNQRCTNVMGLHGISSSADLLLAKKWSVSAFQSNYQSKVKSELTISDS